TINKNGQSKTRQTRSLLPSAKDRSTSLSNQTTLNPPPPSLRRAGANPLPSHLSLLTSILSLPDGIVRTATSTFERQVRACSVLIIPLAPVLNVVVLGERLRLI